jgi:uncharacterized protein YndB with AHSA1/START domain/DNA-binding transcriptional ArsR family regulator
MPDRLSATFAALADPTRRAILGRLVRGETSVTELAKPFDMTLPGISKHLKVLERAGLIERGREAQWRPCRLKAGPLKSIADWVEEYRQFWEESFDRLTTTCASYRERKRNMAAKRNSPSKELAGQELVLTRVFDAPRRLVFKAWTDPKHVAKWWGPHGFTNPVCKLDVRPGGQIRIDMRGPDGTVYPMSGVYQEVVEPERLVFTSAALDERGKPLFEVLTTVTFTEQGGKTTQTLRARVVSRADKGDPYLAGMEAGWTQSLERLKEYLSRGR